MLRPADLEGVETWRLYGLAERDRALPRAVPPRPRDEPPCCSPRRARSGRSTRCWRAARARAARPRAGGRRSPCRWAVRLGVVRAGAAASAYWRGGGSAVDERFAEEAGGPHVLDAAPALFDEVQCSAIPPIGVADWNLDEPRPRRGTPLPGRDPAQPHLRRRAAAALARLRCAPDRRGLDRPAATLAPLTRPHWRPLDGALRDLSERGSRRRRLGDLERRTAPTGCSSRPTARPSAGAVQGVTRYLAPHGRRHDLTDPSARSRTTRARVRTLGATSGRAEGIPIAVPHAPAADRPRETPSAARGQRCGLPAHRDRRRRGGAAVCRGARGRARARAHRDDRPGPAQAQAHEFEDRRPAVEYPINLVCVNAPRAPRLRAQASGSEFFDDR